jgi:hypothetical protein
LQQLPGQPTLPWKKDGNMAVLGGNFTGRHLRIRKLVLLQLLAAFSSKIWNIVRISKSTVLGEFVYVG